MKPIILPATDRWPAIRDLYDFLMGCYPGKEVEVTVDTVRQERSTRQNKALFGHAYKVICDETGADKDDLHRDFCIKHFGLKEQQVLCFEQRRPRRTTTHDENGKRDVISVEEFSCFYAMVERLAAEFGVYILAPDPRWFLD